MGPRRPANAGDVAGPTEPAAVGARIEALANAAAAEAVSRLGPARSPRRDEIDALLALQPDPDAEILPDSPGVTHA